MTEREKSANGAVEIATEDAPSAPGTGLKPRRRPFERGTLGRWGGCLAHPSLFPPLARLGYDGAIEGFEGAIVGVGGGGSRPRRGAFRPVTRRMEAAGVGACLQLV